MVLIAVDSARADHVGHLGYALSTSAGLDALRADATLFETTRTPSSSAVTATASLLTGLAPERHGALGDRPLLAPEVETLAEILAAAGWQTAALSHHANVSEATGFAQGFGRFDGVFGPVDAWPDAGELLAWVREWLADPPDRPFFLYLHTMGAHAPYRVPPAHAARLLGRPPSLELRFGDPLVQVIRGGERPIARALVTPAKRRSLVEQYDTALRYAFHRVGQMLAMLEQAGRLDGALVVITSNHGQELFEHGGFDHGRTLYEEVLRVPLYVKLPGGSRASRFELPVSTLDVMPTLLELLGLPAANLDGRSLAPLLRGEVADLPARDFAHAVSPGGPLTLLRALVRGRHKLIEGIGFSELYDLVLDPGEQQDLSDANREMVLELRRALSEAYPFVPPTGTAPGVN